MGSWIYLSDYRRKEVTTVLALRRRSSFLWHAWASVVHFPQTPSFAQNLNNPRIEINAGEAAWHTTAIGR